MRIVVLGDFHIQKDNLAYTKHAMQDVERVRPDLVVPLGDFGSNDCIGSLDGLMQSYEYLSSIGAPLRPILGNHDLQRESGYGTQKKGTMEQEFRELFRLSSSYGVIDKENYCLLFISTEVQQEDDCYQVQECYSTEQQFNWLIERLEERPDKPCILFSHAPPIGCGLKTVPSVHVRATNAYLDHNHNPQKWFDLFKSYPQIVMWFSAHYHLGHLHPDSISDRYGTQFFITGVHGAATRDGHRHSRVIDIHEQSITVSTLDHENRKLNPHPDWTYNGSLSNLLDNIKLGIYGNHGDQFKKNFSWTIAASIPVGIPGSSIESIFHLDEKRCLLQSDDNYLWEVDIHSSSVLGTIQYTNKEKFLVASSHDLRYVWTAEASRISRIDLESPWRFVRDFNKNSNSEKLSHEIWDLGLSVQAIANVKAREFSLWVASGKMLYCWDPALEQLEEVLAKEMGGVIINLVTDDENLWITIDNGDVWRYDPSLNFIQFEESDVNATFNDPLKMKDPLTTVTKAMIKRPDQPPYQRIYGITAKQDKESQPIMQIWERYG